MKLKYGKKLINLEISARNLLGILEPINNSIKPLNELLKESIVNPIGKPRLVDLLRKNKPTDLVIIVSDITRSIANYSKILEFLVEEIIDAGIDEKNIEFMVALGTHKKHIEEENRQLYGNLVTDFVFSLHDCYNNFISIGKTSTDLEVQVNKRVRDADFVIATGRINFHYLAGFSGGRKTILPGISSYETIRGNHCKLRRNGVVFGETQDNIISQEMDEAAQLFGVDYLLNVVETPEKETEQIFCGDSVYAFEQGVKFFRARRTSKISQKADCAIVSPGNYVKDKTFFFSHKAINSAVNAVKKGGAIILITQCDGRFGNEKFLNYMLENNLDELLTYPEEKIEVGGHRAFMTAKILKDYKVFVLSDLESKTLAQMHFIPIKNLDEGINQIRKDYGEEFKAYILPDGRSVLPVIDKRW